MDRNLGVLANNPANNVDAQGLVYQWGRKAPFPTTKEDFIYTPTRTGTFLTLSPTKTYQDQTGLSFEDMLLETVANPAVFLQIKYGDLWYDNKSESLWGDPEGHKNLANNRYNTNVYTWSSGKSVYAPCPKGYRVVNRFTWTGFLPNGPFQIGNNNSNIVLIESQINIIGAWNYGFTLRPTSKATQGIYYPTTQNRLLHGRLSAENLSSIKTPFIYWSSASGNFNSTNGASDLADRGNVFIFRGNELRLNSYYNGNSLGMECGFGFPVRCVKE